MKEKNIFSKTKSIIQKLYSELGASKRINKVIYIEENDPMFPLHVMGAFNIQDKTLVLRKTSDPNLYKRYIRVHEILHSKFTPTDLCKKLTSKCKLTLDAFEDVRLHVSAKLVHMDKRILDLLDEMEYLLINEEAIGLLKDAEQLKSKLMHSAFRKEFKLKKYLAVISIIRGCLYGDPYIYYRENSDQKYYLRYDYKRGESCSLHMHMNNVFSEMEKQIINEIMEQSFKLSNELSLDYRGSLNENDPPLKQFNEIWTDSVFKKIQLWIDQIENVFLPSQEEDDKDNFDSDKTIDAMEKLLDESIKNEDRLDGEEEDYIPPWGEMKIVQLPLTKTVVKSMKHKRFRRGSFGLNIASMDRFYTDGMIFRKKRKENVKGCSLLIDRSGSMKWSIEDLQFIIENVPNTIIAYYSGDGNYGILCIAGKNGKITEKLDEHLYSGNVIDYPALKWLAKQPEPRIWISDVEVTGVNDTPHPKLLLECLRLCKKYNIKIVNTMEQFLEIIKNS